MSVTGGELKRKGGSAMISWKDFKKRVYGTAGLEAACGSRNEV